MHQKTLYHVSKPPANIQRIPELYLKPILGKGTGRPSCTHPGFSSAPCSAHPISTPVCSAKLQRLCCPL